MKPTSLFPYAAAATLLLAAVFLSAQTIHAQAPPQAPPQGGMPAGAPQPMRQFPAPTNLQALPKDTTGAQIHDIMENWSGSLGVHCDSCHMADPKNLDPRGRPRLNFADDSKPSKKIARLMFTMTQQINNDYITKTKDLDMNMDDKGGSVTCGTCHRGKEHPDAFVIPQEAPPGRPAGAPGMAPPAGATPPPPPGM